MYENLEIEKLLHFIKITCRKIHGLTFVNNSKVLITSEASLLTNKCFLNLLRSGGHIAIFGQDFRITFI